MSRIDILGLRDGMDDRCYEFDIVDILAIGGTATIPAGVPAAPVAIRVGDHKAVGLGHGVPPIRCLGLMTVAKPAMQHDNKGYCVIAA